MRFATAQNCRILCSCILIFTTATTAVDYAEISAFQQANAASSVAVNASTNSVTLSASTERHCAFACSSHVGFLCRSFTYIAENRTCQLGDNFDGRVVRSFCHDPRRSRLVDGVREFCVFQQRTDGNLSFDKSWADFKSGFGTENNFWIGLEKIRQLIQSSSTGRLRVELAYPDGQEYFCEYSNFTVANEAASYAMNYNAYLPAQSNMQGDSLSFTKGSKFTTSDSDHDQWSTGNCAVGVGAWWYAHCARGNANGIFGFGAVNSHRGMFWLEARGSWDPVAWIRLMIQA